MKKMSLKALSAFSGLLLMTTLAWAGTDSDTFLYNSPPQAYTPPTPQNTDNSSYYNQVLSNANNQSLSNSNNRSAVSNTNLSNSGSLINFAGDDVTVVGNPCSDVQRNDSTTLLPGALPAGGTDGSHTNFSFSAGAAGVVR